MQRSNLSARLTVSLLAALALIPASVAAQQASIQGIVTSASTGGTLEGATVAVQAAGQTSRGAVTDRNGFYQIGGVAPGTYTLRASYVGHIEQTQTVTVTPGQRVTANLQLAPAAVTVEGVVVSPPSGAVARDLGRQRITPGDIRLAPVPAGSGDLATYLQTLPGVVTTGDRGGQLFVRGGSASENLILIDGAPIYQPFHILGFFSVFPEDLVSNVDFYAGGFGARYDGRTSSVVDVQLRDGNANDYRAVASVSPFLVEALAEGPLGEGFSWIASARRSLLEETSESLLGTRQPLTFESQLLKLTTADQDGRCSAIFLRTSDRGRLDPEETVSRVGWENQVLGGRCVELLQSVLRLVEVNLSYTSVVNTAVSRGSSSFIARARRLQHDLNSTSLIGSIPVYAGYHLYYEYMDYNLLELLNLQKTYEDINGMGGYVEASLPAGGPLEVRPGVVLTLWPRAGIEPRLRASWKPFGRESEKVQGALGLYRQDLVGATDMRDVGSVFTAWMSAPNGVPVTVLHGSLGWQQSIGGILDWSIEGYYRKLKDVPVPRVNAVAEFATRLVRADGNAYGVDVRLEHDSPHFHAIVNYGYGSVTYESAQEEFGTWFGDPVLRYHPPHDRRHQVNALGRVEFGGFEAGVRWQLGTGLPFTRPLGFDEAFDFSTDLQKVASRPGTTRLVLDRPFTGRLPIMHRLDVSLQRGFDLGAGRMEVQAGAINVYDRQNMFYYDLFTGRRVDQLPLAPYASLTYRTR